MVNKDIDKWVTRDSHDPLSKIVDPFDPLSFLFRTCFNSFLIAVCMYVSVTRLSTVGDRALIPVAAACLWNSLPSHVTAACCPPLSPSSAGVLNHISSHFFLSRF